MHEIPPFAAVVFVLALLSASVVDLRRGIIPDAITLGGTAFALVFAHVATGDLRSSLIGLAAGLALSLAVYALGNILFKTRIQAARETDPGVTSAFGMGDVKLMAFIGAFLGARGAFQTLLIASILAAVVGMILKRRTGAATLPFAPFLAAGGIAVLLC